MTEHSNLPRCNTFLCKCFPTIWRIVVPSCSGSGILRRVLDPKHKTEGTACRRIKCHIQERGIFYNTTMSTPNLTHFTDFVNALVHEYIKIFVDW